MTPAKSNTAVQAAHKAEDERELDFFFQIPDNMGCPCMIAGILIGIYLPAIRSLPGQV